MFSLLSYLIAYILLGGWCNTYIIINKGILEMDQAQLFCGLNSCQLHKLSICTCLDIKSNYNS